MNSEDSKGRSDGAAAAPRLTLFVAGGSPRSQRARANLDRLVAGLDTDAVSIAVVDVLAEPSVALSHSIFATPSLMMEHGEDRSVVAGDLSDPAPVRAMLAPLLPESRQ